MTTEFSAKNDQSLDAIRRGLAQKSGPEYWRSLEEYAQTEAFQEYVRHEFPEHAEKPIDAVTRRNFLQVMGATLALAGATSGCARQPSESIVPYVLPPREFAEPEFVPGKALYYASAAIVGGYARGILVETHMGRPVKFEGLPNHPSSLGGADTQTQATILDMYDPDRSSAVMYRGRVSTMNDFVAAANGVLNDLRPTGGDGIRILTGTVTSPTQAAMTAAFQAKYPKVRWHRWEPCSRTNHYEGTKLLFGNYVDAVYDFTQADVVVSLDSEFLTQGPGNVRYARDFASRRDVEGLAPAAHGGEHGEAAPAAEHAMKPLSRFYAIESAPTTTGASADHRFPVKASHVEAVARALAQKLGVQAGAAADIIPADQLRWVDAIAADLNAHTGHAVVVPGDHQSPVVHALAHAINGAIGAAGKTVRYIDPVEASPSNDVASLKTLVDDLNAGSVKLLIINSTNPVYSAPADFDFASALAKAGTAVHLGRYIDETARLCEWHLPESHPVESWGDARGHDGTVSLIQPTIGQLYIGSLTPIELLSILTDEEPRTGYDIVREYWQKLRQGADFESFWRVSLADGTVSNSQSWDAQVSAQPQAFTAYTPVESKGFEVVLLPDPTVLDGTFANNSWMQELPKPLTKLTWDNAVLMAYADAAPLGITNEDLVEVSVGTRTIKGPVWIQPGHARGVVTLHLGYGRSHAGKVGDGMGFNAYTLRTSDALNVVQGASIRKLGGKYPLARTEEHYNMEGRSLVRHVTQGAYSADPGVVHAMSHEPDEATTLLHPEKHAWDGYAWGMTIDLNKCTGCSACITACQSENIIPSVGKFEVRKGREMHWIRVDRYYSTGQTGYGFAEVIDDGMDNPKTYIQPVPCMQCENALCEMVCPVGATQHSREGLNDMVYNRCIGTRYCSNNCPYKVRRFNFYNFGLSPRGRETYLEKGEKYPETMKPMRNPDVTVRTRGVMEKCTYCVQRINLARIDSKKEGRDVRDGEITTACQQACPSAAITFGNINDPDSEVARLKASHRNYSLLGDLNTRPRTTYLARLTNPNPELEA